MDDNLRIEEETTNKKRRDWLIIVVAIMIAIVLLLTFSNFNNLVDTYIRTTTPKDKVYNIFTNEVYADIYGNEVEWYCRYNKHTDSYETYVYDANINDFVEIYPVSGIWDRTVKISNPTTKIYYVSDNELDQSIGQYVAVIEGSDINADNQKVIYNDIIEVDVGVSKAKDKIIYQTVKNLNLL